MSVLSPPSPFDPRVLFLTWGGSGFLRPASGTWGTLFALPFAWGIHTFGGGGLLLVSALLIYIVAIPCVQWYEKRTKSHDSSRIVIDEVIGIFITLSVAYVNNVDYIAGFFLFRAFDALKPGPVGWIDERIKGPHGVLLDDVIAGILAAICILFIHGISTW